MDPRFARSSSALLKFLSLARNGLFGLLFVLQRRKESISTPAFVFHQVIEFLQLMFFVVNHRAHFAWSSDIAPLQYAAEFSVTSGYFDVADSPVFYLLLVIVTIVWTALFVSSALWAVFEFSQSRIPHMSVLRALRSIATFSATIGFIPLFEILLSVLSCGSEYDPPDKFWSSLGYSCFAGGHLAFVVVSLLCASAFLALVGIYAFIFIDSNPLSPGYDGCSSGHAALLTLLWKAVMIFLVQTIPDRLGSWGVTSVVVIAGLAHISITFFFMPATTHMMNRIQLAFGFAFFSTAIAVALSEGYPGFNGAILAYAGIIPAALFGVFLVDVRRLRLLQCVPSRLSAPHEIDLWARYVLSDALERVLGDFAEAPATSNPGGSAAAGPSVVIPIGHPPRLSDAAGVAVGCPMMRPAAAVPDAKPRDLSPEVYASMDVDERTDVVHKYMPADLLVQVESVLRAAAVRFPRSAMLQLYIARFYQTYAGQPQRAMGHLMRALRLEAPLDVEFVVYAARRTADSQAGIDVQNTITRLGFDKAIADVRVAMMCAMQAQAELFEDLCKLAPRFGFVHKCWLRYNESVAVTESAFRTLFAINSQSVVALRLFSQFNEMILNDEEKAESLADEADRLDEQQQRAQRRDEAAAGGGRIIFSPTTNQIVPGESCGILVIATSPQLLGQITYASQTACDIFGYSRTQLERRDISVIIPEPIASTHHQMLERYLRTGRSSIIDATRVMLGRHKHGHLITIQLRIRDVPTSETSLGVAVGQNDGFVLMGLVRLVNAFAAGGGGSAAPEELILATEDERITSATLGGLRLLCASADELATGVITIEDVIPTWSSVQAAASTAQGTIVQVVPLRSPSSDSPVPQSAAPSTPQALSPRANHAAVLAEVLGYDRASNVPPALLARVRIQRQTFAGSSSGVSVLSISPVAISTGFIGVGDADGGNDDAASSVGRGRSSPRTSPTRDVSAPRGEGFSPPHPSRLPPLHTAGGGSGAARRLSATAPATSSADADPRVDGARAARASSVLLSSKTDGDEQPQSTSPEPGTSSIPLPGMILSPRDASELVTAQLREVVTTDGQSTVRERKAAPEGRRNRVGRRASRSSMGGGAQADGGRRRYSGPAADQGGRERTLSAADERIEGSLGGTRRRPNLAVPEQGARERTASAAPEDRADRSSTGSRVDTGVRLLARLRHAIAEGKKAKLKNAPALRWLRSAIISLILINVILAIIQAVVISDVFDGFSSNVSFAKASEHVAFSFYPVTERVRLCMLDSGGVLNRATVDVVAERSELRTGVTALHESAQSLQDLITAGTDPSKLGSDLSIVLANFDNAPVLFVNTSAFDTDPSTRRAAAPFGATSLLAPLGGDGASVLLASKSTTSVMQATWALVGASKAIAQGLAPEIASSRPASCSAVSSAPWTLVVNDASGSQFHERLRSSLATATANDTNAALIRSPLIVFVVMILAIFLCGCGIVIPNLHAVGHLQDELSLALHKLPVVLLRALAMQAASRADALRKQLDVINGGSSDQDDLDGESEGGSSMDGEDAGLMPINSALPASSDTGNIGDVDFLDADGEISWFKVVAAARRATAAQRGVTEQPRGLRTYCRAPPLRLIIFAVPVLLLIPFYVVVFATTQTAVHSALVANDFFLVATKRAGYAAESSLNFVVATATVGVAADAQSYVGAAWQSLVDLQAHNFYLLYHSTDSSRPIGTGPGSNPAPSAFDATLPFAEINGVPGVDAGALASVKSAMFTDGCPLVSSISGVSLAQCYAYTGGPQHGGLLGVTTKLLSLGQALNQAKADQVAAAQAAAALVPAEGLAFSASATLTSGSAATFQALGRRVLAPAFAYIADLYADAALGIASNQLSFVIKFSAAFTAAFTLFMTALLLPTISLVARELHRKRGLLLVLPHQTVSSLSVVRALITTAVAEAEAEVVDRGRGGGPSSGRVSRRLSQQSTGLGGGPDSRTARAQNPSKPTDAPPVSPV